MEDKIFLVHPIGSEAGTLETLPDNPKLQLVSIDDLRTHKIAFSENDKVCITSEACLVATKDHMTSEHSRLAIDLLKDKGKFREVLRSMFPDYRYTTLAFDDIKNLTLKKPAVLKPQKGCFGSGVRIVDSSTNFATISEEIKEEIQRNATVLSDDVLSSDTFIMEDYIEGEEYAVDLFYDDNGKPQIINIYYHPIPKHKEYLHMIYCTSKKIHVTIFQKAYDFFTDLGRILGVKNFVLHSEFRMTSDGILFPIEINSMRYGGMGLGNMMYHSAGIDPYECFLNGVAPDWKAIWSKKDFDTKTFVYLIAYNGKNADTTTSHPDINKLKSQFTHLVNECLFDYKTQLAFGAFSLIESEESLNKLLAIDFDDYFIEDK